MSLPSKLLPAVFCTVGALLASLAAGRLAAQQDAPAGFRSYGVSNVAAEQVATQVRNVVSGQGQNVEVLFDGQQNRVLVRGSEEAQRLAAQMIAALDRPANIPDQQAAANQPEVKYYRVGAEQLDAAVRDLQQRWPESTGVRIAADARLGQVVVLATPRLHEQIAQRLDELTRGDGNFASPQPARKTVSRSYQLQNIAWRDLEMGLQQTWGVQLRVSTRNNGELATFHRLGIMGGQAQVHVDRRHNQVTIEGPAEEVNGWALVVQALDTRQTDDSTTQLVPLGRGARPGVMQAVSLIREAEATAPASPPRARAAGNNRTGRLLNTIFQQNQPGGGNQPPGAGGAGAGAAGAAGASQILGGAAAGALGIAEQAGFIGNVQIEYVEGLDIYIIRGRKPDVDRVVRLIEEIERLSAQTQPVIDILHLRNMDSTAMATLVTQVYDQILSPRSGQVSITALVRPNALLLIGRADALRTVADMIRRLDQPVDPARRMRVFQLRFMNAVDAEERINRFYADPTGLGTRARVVADYRSNTIVVVASPADMKEIATMLDGMDTNTSSSRLEVRIFRLKNSLATNLAPVLQDAINGQLANHARSELQQQAPAAAVASQPGTSQIASHSLSFMTVDPEGGRLIKGGLVFDVKVTADSNANALIVNAPPDSMELIGALIDQLDQPPSAQAQIKVFTLINGNAAELTAMLQQLFGQVTATAGGAFGGLNQAALQSLVAAGGQTSLVPLRFSIDIRTNSIIVTGSEGTINVVEALIVRLDLQTARNRRTTVYRLRNAPVADVAQALNNFLTRQLANYQALPGQLSPYELVDREVIIEPEVISNSLIVSATPMYFEAIRAVIEQLDARPPMVAIQVVLAEVTLNNTLEFGVQWGLQNSLLFDRGIVNDTNPPASATAPPPAIRFNFNQSAIGNDNTAASLATRPLDLGQILSNLNLGRVSSTAGFGGLVMSMGSDSVNALLRALSQRVKIQILSRPQVTTLENQPAFVVVGQQIRLPSSVVATNTSTQQGVQVQNVGIVLGVTPRTTPDGVVVMEVDAEKSSLGQASEGTTVGFSTTGVPLQVPPINLTQLATTVRARSGQTIVLAGLIQKEKDLTENGIPILQDIPLAGWLFRFDTDVETRSELLIIMTPYIMYHEEELNELKRVETKRMNWSLEQVVEMHGDIGVGPMSEGQVPVIYPDLEPTATEPLPPAEGSPNPVPPAPPSELPPGVRPNAGAPSSGGNGASSDKALPGVNVPARRSSRRTEPGPIDPGVYQAGAWPQQGGGRIYDNVRADYWRAEPQRPTGPVPPANYRSRATAFPPQGSVGQWPLRPLPPTE